MVFLLPLLTRINRRMLALYIAYPSAGLFSRKVRVHSALVWRAGSWIRLWYLLRGLDKKGRGRIDISISIICNILNCKQSTIYEWLRVGKKKGGFRLYVIKSGVLRCYFGGLHHVAWLLNLEDLGAVSVVNLEEIKTLASVKKVAARGTAERGQFASIYKQRLKLNEQERKHYKPIFPETIFDKIDQCPSPKPDAGEVPGIIWIGRKRIFCNAGFLPFGISQDSIGCELGVSVWSVRRHLKGVDRRQICQSKSAYRTIGELFEHCESDVPRREIRPNTYFQINSEGLGFLEESVGQSSQRISSVVRKQRVFRYRDLYWMYRCNVYRPTQRLTSMSRSRAKLKYRFKHLNQLDNQLAQLMIQFCRAAAWGGYLSISESYIRRAMLGAF